ncbi:PD-(D/E)XK motif protein [Brevibacterium atlanticum]|uniref:PD-(D/E)XK motif protein n=1 Tax=Brevibacterium atlanticum TaxID=2697563 RepID=UPI00141E9140|nr:PD-(D/E)XK motif protein [Brevibacterium atlanticum]
MSSTKEIFHAAQRDGSQLVVGEASVLVADSTGRRRTWLGYQEGKFAVAYFETDSEREVSFSVSKVISIQSVDVNDETTGTMSRALKVVCHEPRLDEVFFVFIDDVRNSLEGDSDVIELVNAAASDWRRLLHVAMTELSESAAAGIYGELRFLESLTDSVGPSAIACWQRTAQDIHDFTGESARVEVKTSAFQNRSAVTIHGLRQLEPPTTGTLTLAVAEVQRHGADSIYEAAERLRGLGVDHAVLTEKLRDAGYVEGMPGSGEHTFSLISWRFWEIDRQTPALNRSMLTDSVADAVSSLSYSLSLGSLGESSSKFDCARLAAEGSSSI